jgi:hypothetical protein
VVRLPSNDNCTELFGIQEVESALVPLAFFFAGRSRSFGGCAAGFFLDTEESRINDLRVALRDQIDSTSVWCCEGDESLTTLSTRQLARASQSRCRSIVNANHGIM